MALLSAVSEREPCSVRKVNRAVHAVRGNFFHSVCLFKWRSLKKGKEKRVVPRLCFPLGQHTVAGYLEEFAIDITNPLTQVAPFFSWD